MVASSTDSTLLTTTFNLHIASVSPLFFTNSFRLNDPYFYPLMLKVL